MAIMTLISIWLRLAWGTGLCFGIKGVWVLLVIAGFIQIAVAAVVDVGLATSIDPSAGQGWGVVLLLIMAFGLVAYTYRHHVALMPRTFEITEERNPYLFAVVNEQAQLAGLPMPKVIESPYFTASAIGGSSQNPVLVVSPDLQQSLGRRQLGAILAHEIAHLKYGDSLIMTIFMMIVGFTLGASLLVGFSGWIGAIVLLFPVMSWPREFRADKAAANVSGGSVALVSALHKLEGGSFLSSLYPSFTHPPTKLRQWRLKRLANRSV